MRMASGRPGQRRTQTLAASLACALVVGTLGHA